MKKEEVNIEKNSGVDHTISHGHDTATVPLSPSECFLANYPAFQNTSSSDELDTVLRSDAILEVVGKLFAASCKLKQQEEKFEYTLQHLENNQSIDQLAKARYVKGYNDTKVQSFCFNYHLDSDPLWKAQNIEQYVDVIKMAIEYGADKLDYSYTKQIAILVLLGAEIHGAVPSMNSVLRSHVSLADDGTLNLRTPAIASAGVGDLIQSPLGAMLVDMIKTKVPSQFHSLFALIPNRDNATKMNPFSIDSLVRLIDDDQVGDVTSLSNFAYKYGLTGYGHHFVEMITLGNIKSRLPTSHIVDLYKSMGFYAAGLFIGDNIKGLFSLFTSTATGATEKLLAMTSESTTPSSKASKVRRLAN